MGGYFRVSLCQLAGEQKPRFSSSNEAFAIPFAALGLRKLLFGHSSAFSRREHRTLHKHSPTHPTGEILGNGDEVSLIKIEQHPKPATIRSKTGH
jgi:hypothetical protein